MNIEAKSNLPDFLDKEVFPHVLPDAAVPFAQRMITSVGKALHQAIPQIYWSEESDVTPITVLGTLTQVMDGQLDMVKYMQVKDKFVVLAEFLKAQNVDPESPAYKAVKGCTGDWDIDMYLHWPGVELEEIKELINTNNIDWSKTDLYHPEIETRHMGKDDNLIEVLTVWLVDQDQKHIFHMDIVKDQLTPRSHQNDRRLETGGYQDMQRPVVVDENGTMYYGANRRADKAPTLDTPSKLEKKPHHANAETLLRELRKRIAAIVSSKKIPQNIDVADILTQDTLENIAFMEQEMPAIFRDELTDFRRLFWLSEYLTAHAWNYQLATEYYTQLGIEVDSPDSPFVPVQALIYLIDELGDDDQPTYGGTWRPTSH